MTALHPSNIAKLSDKMAVVLASQLIKENKKLFIDLKDEKITKKMAWEIISRYAVDRCNDLRFSDSKYVDFTDIYNIARIRINQIKPSLLDSIFGY